MIVLIENAEQDVHMLVFLVGAKNAEDTGELWDRRFKTSFVV